MRTPELLRKRVKLDPTAWSMPICSDGSWQTQQDMKGPLANMILKLIPLRCKLDNLYLHQYFWLNAFSIRLAIFFNAFGYIWKSMALLFQYYLHQYFWLYFSILFQYFLSMSKTAVQYAYFSIELSNITPNREKKRSLVIWTIKISDVIQKRAPCQHDLKIINNLVIVLIELLKI